jgi:hypothetical protein
MVVTMKNLDDGINAHTSKLIKDVRGYAREGVEG